jgi:hypothetical protein
MSESASEVPPFNDTDARRVDAWVNQVEVELDRRGVPTRKRRQLSAELQRDLDAAGTAGANADDLIDEDAARFARDLAEANGLVLLATPVGSVAAIRTMVVTAVSAAMLAALVSWFLIYPAIVGAGSARYYKEANATIATGRAFGSAEVILVYGLGSALVVSSALGAVRWRFRQDPVMTRQALVRIGCGLVVGGLVGIVPTVVFAHATGYSSAVGVVFLETATAGLFGAAGVWMLLRGLPGAPARAEGAMR